MAMKNKLMVRVHLQRKDARGNLYFGAWGEPSNVGLERIYPERYSSAAAVYLRSLDINQKPFFTFYRSEQPGRIYL